MDECRLGSVLTSGSVFWVRSANERKSNTYINRAIFARTENRVFVYRPSKICSNQRVTFKIDWGAGDRKILSSRKILCASVYKHFVIYAAHPGGDGLFMNSTVRGFIVFHQSVRPFFIKRVAALVFIIIMHLFNTTPFYSDTS